MKAGAIEALRAEGARLEALETRIAELEDEKHRLLGSTRNLEGALEELHGLMGEWEWFFEHALEMMCICGMDGVFKRVNPAFVRALGHANEKSKPSARTPTRRQRRRRTGR